MIGIFQVRLGKNELTLCVCLAFLSGPVTAQQRADATPTDSQAPAVASTSRPSGYQRLSPDPSRPRPNIILYVVDTMRADELACYGSAVTRTPAFDRLAAEGTLFERDSSTASATRPSMASLITGLDAHIVGAWNSIHSLAKLPDSVPRLPVMLRDAGYYTIAVVANPNCAAHYGFDKGFDAFHTTYAASATQQNAAQTRRLVSDAPVVVTKLQEAVAEAPAGKPFFVFVLSIDPHDPYTPPPPYEAMYDENAKGQRDGTIQALKKLERMTEHGGRPTEEQINRVRSLYRGEISYADQHFGRFVDWLRSTGRLDNTLLVLTADHGEEFFEHGHRGHNRTLYDEVLHIPLIMRLPGIFPSAKRVSDPVDMLDLTATVAAVGGAQLCSVWTGRDLREPLKPRPRFCTLLNGKSTLMCVTREDSKMIYEKPAGRATYFDLAADPGERTALQADAPLRAKDALGESLKSADAAAQSIRDQRKAEHIDSDSDAPQDVLQALRALGYVD